VTGLDRAFPPVGLERLAIPVRGAVVPPSRGRDDAQEVLLGLVAHRPGVFVFRGLAVDYSVGKARYRATFAESMRICVPRSYRGRCEPPSFSG
jgi:hypothetical protein